MLLLLFSMGSLLLNIFFGWQNWQRSIVTSVPDGDSIQLADGRRVRLLGIDAPEREECMADHARALLSDLAKQKHVQLADVVTDDYGRQLANVSAGGTILNLALVERGLARFVYVTSPLYERMKGAQTDAKQARLGIWGEQCRSETPKNEDCAIKGNIKEANRTYHLPDCANYGQTIIDESFGDRWFCTEQEAIAAGFDKASGCPR